ncbi:MAG: hypothetical protein KDA05_01680 [Phycisphaerales bacterium]|nr:hypothetical protein [Phycisphaerales bacterium]
MSNVAAILAVVLGCCCIPAAAQTATIRLVHDDPDGLVEPGHVVRIAAMLHWDMAYLVFAATGGDVVTSPALGVSADPETPFYHVGTSPGTPWLGGVRDFRATGTPPLFVPLPLPPQAWRPDPVAALTFDWTAPAQAGEYSFEYVPSAEFPSIMLYPATNSQFGVPVSSAYFGTSLTVVPAPATWLPGAGAIAIISPRRRRSR